jgi:hypothetical protein
VWGVKWVSYRHWWGTYGPYEAYLSVKPETT